jgi:3-phosphoshikimate 1-carboxyvinyltransferase
VSDLTVPTIDRPFRVSMTPPGSKSLTNRALILAALTDGTSDISNVLYADDTRVMIDALGALGFSLEQRDTTIRISGRGGAIPSRSAQLFCGNSGTSIRFLTALVSLGEGVYTLDGIERMRQRPISALVDLLTTLGVRCEYLGQHGFPPVKVLADGLAGGAAEFGREMSSQFLSAALMVSPFARREVRVNLASHQTSWPYVAMTVQLMEHFGIRPQLTCDPKSSEPTRIVVPRGHYRATRYRVEPDASNAGYFLALAAIHPGATVTIQGLGKNSLQGDVGFADVLRAMGADLTLEPDFITITGTERFEGIDIDLGDMPDTAQTLAVAALFAKGLTTIRGLQTLRVKETDRLSALATELAKLGARVAVDNSSIAITPPNNLRSAAIDTYNDHRMAMSFALAGTKRGGVTIRDIECVNKTYPDFFEDLERVRTSTHRAP